MSTVRRRPTPPRKLTWRQRWQATVAMSGVGRTLAITAVVAVIAGVAQWLLWLRESPAGLETFIGPPRSDYQLSDFTLITLDEAGKLAFRVESPRLARHPFVGSLEIDTPRFVIHDAHGNAYRASSRSAWVSQDAKELRLQRDVDVQRPAAKGAQPFTLKTQSLTGRIDTDRLVSDDAVTITQPGSILRGVGLDADLRQNRLVLKNQVQGRYDRKLQP